MRGPTAVWGKREGAPLERESRHVIFGAAAAGWPLRLQKATPERGKRTHQQVPLDFKAAKCVSAKFQGRNGGDKTLQGGLCARGNAPRAAKRRPMVRFAPFLGHSSPLKGGNANI